MCKYFENYPERLHFFVGLSYLIIGALISIFSNIQWGAILITVGIAFIAYGASRQSGELTEKIAHSVLHETISIIEDARLKLREKSEKIEEKKRIFEKDYTNKQLEFDRDVDYNICYSFNIWKLVRYIDRLLLFKNLLTPKEKNMIIDQINLYLGELKYGNIEYEIQLKKNYIKNLWDIIENISKFKEFNDESNTKFVERKQSIYCNFCHLKKNMVPENEQIN